MLEVFIGQNLMRLEKKLMRDKPIDESKYTELTEDFKNTYFEEVYKVLKSKFKLGRV